MLRITLIEDSLVLECNPSARPDKSVTLVIRCTVAAVVAWIKHEHLFWV